MSTTRKLKKSESLEIRIPYPTKEAFMARCREDGRSASEALRLFIDQHLEAPPRPAPRRASRRRLHLAIGAAIAAAVGAVALPSLALSPAVAQAREAQVHRDFTRADADHDGRITFEEFRRTR